MCLWLRPDLASRDRSLVTVSALGATGQVAQIPYHLNRAMDNGLTKEQAGEAITHLAFYVGWPNAFSALPMLKDVLKSISGTGSIPTPLQGVTAQSPLHGARHPANLIDLRQSGG
jgi:alkylhydroperoxidase/carboxymuconolactone decarboxylase family protein YurZ